LHPFDCNAEILKLISHPRLGKLLLFQNKRYHLLLECLGQNIAHITYEVGKGQLIYWGKRRFGYALVSYVGWVAAPVMPIITNSTKVLKIANFTHRVTSEIFEISENGACAWMYPIDLVVFGQPVPVGSEGRFNIISNATDVFDN
jgi:hypothetical protein